MCNIMKHWHDFLEKKIYGQYSEMMLFCDINCTIFHTTKRLDVIAIISNIGNTVSINKIDKTINYLCSEQKN